MSELYKKVQGSIDRIKRFDPLSFSGKDSYYLAFSGGKDSVVCKALLEMAGVKYDAHYRVTTVDPPELVRFIKEKHPDVSRDVPRYTEYGGGAYGGDDMVGKPISMWNLIPIKLMPPTRVVRYCCDFLKESGGDGRMTITGVRWAESVNRQKKQGLATISGSAKIVKEFADNPYFRITGNNGAVLVNDNAETREVLDACTTRYKTCLNPIIDWTDKDVWEFIKAEGIPYCELYDEGFHRLGCIGCPMAGKQGRKRGFLRWPKYKNSYLFAFSKMLQHRAEKGRMSGTWRIGTTAQDVFNWWMRYDVLPGQISFEELAAEYEEYD